MEMPYGLPPGFEFPPGALAPSPAASNPSLMQMPPSFAQQDGHPPHFAFSGYPPLHLAAAGAGMPLPVAGRPVGVAAAHPLAAAGAVPEAEAAASKQQNAHHSTAAGGRPHEDRDSRDGGRHEGRGGGGRREERERPLGPEGARNLYIHNVPRDASEDDVRQFFSKCGEVENVFLRVNQKIGPNAVYAFVLYRHPEDARRCFDTMNGAQFGGRCIRVEYQRGRRGGAGAGQDGHHAGSKDNDAGNSSAGRNDHDYHRSSEYASRESWNRSDRERDRGDGGSDSRWRPTPSGRGAGGDRDDSRRSQEPRGGRGGDRGASSRDDDGRGSRYADEHGRRGSRRGTTTDRASRDRETTQGGAWARQPLYLSALLQERKPHLRIPSMGGKGAPAPTLAGVPPSSPPPASTGFGGARTPEGPQAAADRPPASQPLAPQLPPATAGASVLGSAWEWTLGRNDKRRVQVRASLCRGEVPASLVHLSGLLNVSHRSKWEEVAAKTIHAVVTLEAAHPDQQVALDEYISYFTSKERAGVANASTHYVYLVPPSCSLFARYKCVLPARLQQATNFLLGLVGPQYSSAAPSAPAVAEGAQPAPAAAAPQPPHAAQHAFSEFQGGVAYAPAASSANAQSASLMGLPPSHQLPVHPAPSAAAALPTTTPALDASFAAPQQPAPAPAAAASGAGGVPLAGLGQGATANWMQQLSTMAAFLGGKK
ncbi:SPOC domain-containing protein [Besnoitia besnoiti]|uniref:SPOC domain-containing protein n=1 Tax=Besnoitia besnoiti TaxID=94643 RepID=A0A2A9MH67_BESBE|nr:SPOC domain-containing protein [Besnoitia besnoiti]PFH35306.1 SPOC domain-containing protein [Besnoitia besnoiti]